MDEDPEAREVTDRLAPGHRLVGAEAGWNRPARGTEGAGCGLLGSLGDRPARPARPVGA